MPHTVSLRRAALIAAGLGLLAACGSSKPAPPATSTTQSAAAVGAAYQEAVDVMRAATTPPVERRTKAVKAFAVATAETTKQSALAEIKSAAAEQRAKLAEFDVTLRKLSFPDAVAVDRNTLLTENGAIIAILDDVGKVTSADEYDAVVKRENAALKTWRTAVDKVATALGVPGSSKPLPTTTTTGSPPGTVLKADGYHMTVPPGFTGSATGTIIIRGPDKVVISTGRVTGYTGSVEEVAKKYFEAAASKQSATIQSGPTKRPTGGFGGIEYRLLYPDGNVEISVLAEKAPKYAAIDIRGTKEAVAANEQVFLSTVQTFGFDS